MAYVDPTLPDPTPHNELVPRVAPLRGLASTATALITANCLLNIATVWSDWHSYGLASDYVAGDPDVTVADLNDADSLNVILTMLFRATYVAAGVMFIVWLYRARHNSELINDARHRRSRGWVIGAWFCPVVNLWFPHQIVADVWRTSDPDEPPDLYQVAGLPSPPLVRWWWSALLLANVVSTWERLGRGPVTLDWFREQAVVNTISTALLCVAAVLVAPIIRRISEWQAIPRPPRESTRRA